MNPPPGNKRSFLRENWLYILAPVLLVLALLVALYLFAGGESSEMIYNLFG
ncbi:MAG: hypothetical protein RL277_2632 [Planctomycetota bacterium]